MSYDVLCLREGSPSKKRQNFEEIECSVAGFGIVVLLLCISNYWWTYSNGFNEHKRINKSCSWVIYPRFSYNPVFVDILWKENGVLMTSIYTTFKVKSLYKYRIAMKSCKKQQNILWLCIPTYPHSMKQHCRLWNSSHCEKVEQRRFSSYLDSSCYCI